ncbi:predicted protein [Plenodomus lingam JN3]|uniref:Predicted protein n=2 Tax=Leptosphaeria maculans TaxID=5022 RepID=E4ZTB0_LEPMJ|nr:predicted protein [Plenodomus lingam JN3]CBX94766.1 predicted protein [Plenodomus lingam JN3]
MANIADLKPFDMLTEVMANCKKEDALVVDVGRNEHGLEVKSQQHLLDLVDNLLSRPDNLKKFRSLYILGAWRLTPSKENWGGFGEYPKYHEGEPHVFTKQEEEWHLAGKNIARLAAAMPNIEELIWLASLAFTAHVWEGLNTSMTKIIIDLGYPVRLIVNGFSAHESFITSDELKPLVQQTKLKELRLFHMKDDSYSYQPVIWETVYRNSNENGMRLLDINMADPPIVRSEHWHKAEDVAGLTVAHCKTGDKDYKHVTTLHHQPPTHSSH